MIRLAVLTLSVRFKAVLKPSYAMSPDKRKKTAVYEIFTYQDFLPGTAFKMYEFVAFL